MYQIIKIAKLPLTNLVEFLIFENSAPEEFILFRKILTPVIVASYCNKFFQICHPSIFYRITSGENNNITNIIIINMGQEKEQNKISISR